MQAQLHPAGLLSLHELFVPHSNLTNTLPCQNAQHHEIAKFLTFGHKDHIKQNIQHQHMNNAALTPPPAMGEEHRPWNLPQRNTENMLNFSQHMSN